MGRLSPSPTLPQSHTFGDTLVIAHNEAAFRAHLERIDREKILIDLVRLWPENSPILTHANYFGICW